MAARTKRCRLLAAESSRCPTICFRFQPPSLHGTLAKSAGTSSSRSRNSLISAQNVFATLVDIGLTGPRGCSYRHGAGDLLIAWGLLFQLLQLRQHLFRVMRRIDLGPDL